MSEYILNILNFPEDGAPQERKSGDIAANFPANRHICHFYENPRELLSMLTTFFADGLTKGEFCLWGVGAPLTLESAQDALDRVMGGTLDAYIQAGQLEIFDVSLLYGKGPFDAMAVKDAFLQKVRNSLGKGWNGFRCDGMVPDLAPATWRNFQTYETEVSRSLKPPVTALCSYNLGRLSAEQVYEVVAAHHTSIIKQDEHWHVLKTVEHLALLEAQRQGSVKKA